MGRNFPVLWKIFALVVAVAQVQKIYLAFASLKPYSMPEAFDWVMSFPECVVVCLFAAKIAIGLPAWWRWFSFIYPFYALFVVSVCVKLYIFEAVPAGHPIPYGLALLIVTAMKIFSVYAIWHYGREPNIWRWKARGVLAN